MAKAYYACGCFWGAQYFFSRLKGVYKTTVGFMGGQTKNPDYEDVKTGKTGHLETIEVEYDPDILPYANLTRFFFEIHDFEQTDGQGLDIGSQYLSAIFYTNIEEKTISEFIAAELRKMGYKVATQIRIVETFYPADTFHQHYLDRAHETPECHAYRHIFGSYGNLKIRDRNAILGQSFPHKIYFNDKIFGIMQQKELWIKDLPAGTYKFKVQSLLPFIYSEKEIKVEKGDNMVTFSNNEPFWDILFTIDLAFSIARFFITMSPTANLIYLIATNGFFVIWLIHEWITRKRHFLIKYKTIDSPNKQQE